MSGSKYFSTKELACNCCGKANMDTAFLEQLNILREVWGKPLTLTSAFRCPEHNAKVGGAAGSQHVLGKAVDIDWATWSGSDRFAFLQLAMERFNGIGLHPLFIHIDSRQQKTTFFYGKK